MVEQGSTVDPKFKPKIEAKDKLRNPLAQRIAIHLANLAIPLREIRPDISVENRVIRNAGILVGDFRSRYFEDDVDLERRRVKKEWLVGRFKNGELTDKDNERFCTMQQSERRYSNLEQGKLPRREVELFLSEMQRAIPNSLAIIPEIGRQILHSPDLTIEELLSLSVIHSNPKRGRALEKAMQHLVHSNGTGKLVFLQLKDYLFSLERGIHSAVFRDKHATPLRNGVE